MAKRKKRGISLGKLLRLAFVSIALVFILIAAFYGIIMGSKTSAESINQEMVLEKLGTQLVLPEVEPNKVMRVSDAKELALQDEFYKNVKNGDYIILYDNLMLIYNFDQKLIKNVKTR